MMNEVKMLERAAKAAHIAIKFDARGAYIYEDGVAGGSVMWNPLADDGDAFRLMVDMRLLVDVQKGYCCAMAPDQPSDDFFEAKEMHEGDTRAAMRRAIVRAAAGIKGDE